MNNTKEETEQWYRKYEERTGIERNDGLKNPEVTFQRFAFDASLISALRAIKFENSSISSGKILDVGCGSGGSFFNFIRLGFDPSMMYGIDILPNKIDEGRRKFPNINFICDDASNINFPDNTFDIVVEVGMFIQLTNDELSAKIANEMLRVTKSEGYVILVDWRYSNPRYSEYKGLSTKRIVELFQAGKNNEILGTYKGALVPPIGRFLSKNMPFAYFLVQSIFPFLVGQITTVLRKS